MTYYPENGDAEFPIDTIQLTNCLRGYAWADGLDATLSNSSSEISLNFTSGGVLHAGTKLNVNSDTVPTTDGDPSDPRWDAFCVDANGNIVVKQGMPDSISNYPNNIHAQQFQGERAYGTPVPEPVDTELVELVVLCLLWVPAGANNSTDLQNTGKQHIFDRRLDRGTAIDVAGALDPDNSYTMAGLTVNGPSHLQDVTATNVTAETVDTGAVSKNASYRRGSVVVYDARDSGPYIDGQDALSDVPPGGTMRLAATDYDVAAEGRLHRTGSAVSIKGTGYHSQAGPDIVNGADGTRIINTGNDTIDSPPIHLEGPSGTARYAGSTISDLWVGHEGATSPAILIEDQVGGVFSNIQVNCFKTGKEGFRIAGRAWSNRVYNSSFNNFTSAGVFVESSGSHNELYSVYTFATGDNAIGIDIHDQRTYVLGGEDRIYGNGTVGVRISGGTGSSLGSVCQYRLIENCHIGFLVGEPGGESTSKVMIHTPHGRLNSTQGGTDTLVEFRGAHDCVAWYPRAEYPGGGGSVAIFGNSNNCGLVHGGGDITDAKLDVRSDSTNCYQMVLSASTGANRVQTDSELMTWVAYDQSIGSPIWHDGANWYRSNKTQFTP